MYILLEACMHPGVLRILYFVFLILDVIFVIVPIGLILMLLFDFSKAMISNPDDAKKNSKLAVKRIIYAIIIFAIPWITNVFNSSMEEIGFNSDYTLCVKNAKSGNFKYFDELAEQEEKALEEARLAKLEAIKSESSEVEKNTASGSTYESAAEALINHAKKETGTVGGKKYIGSTGEHWCGAFVTWNLKNVSIDGVGTIYSVFTKEGNITSDNLASGTTKECYKHSNLNFYPSKQYDGNYTPKKGDIIYFWYPSRNDGKYWDKNIEHVRVSSTYAIDHVGLVDYVDSSGKVHTVEGNTGGTGNPNTNRVGQNSYSLSYDGILGYCSWYDSKK